MTTDALKIVKGKFDPQGPFILAITMVALICFAAFSSTVSPLAVWSFLYKYIGFTICVLLPMAVFILASYVLWIFGELRAGTPWVTILERIVTTSQAVAFLGTAVAIGQALMGLSAENMAGDGFTTLALQYGNALWSTAVGICLWIAGHILVEDCVSPSIDCDEIKDAAEKVHPVINPVGLREKRLFKLVKKQRAELESLRNQVGNATKSESEETA